MRYILDTFSRILIAILVATMGYVLSQVTGMRDELHTHEQIAGHPVMEERVATMQRTLNEIRTTVRQNNESLVELKNKMR